MDNLISRQKKTLYRSGTELGSTWHKTKLQLVVTPFPYNASYFISLQFFMRVLRIILE